MQINMEDFNNEMDKILTKNNLPNESHAIKLAIDAAQDELRTAIMNGQSNLMLELDSRIRILSARAFGADVSETKNLIDKAELEKVSIAKELALLREIKKQKNLQAGKAEQLFFRRMEKVQLAEFNIQSAENRLESARELSRESNAKLQKLLDMKQKEQANAYEKYELSKY